MEAATGIKGSPGYPCDGTALYLDCGGGHTKQHVDKIAKN